MSHPSLGFRWQSFGMAFVLESLAIVAVLVWAVTHPPVVSAITPVDIQMETTLADKPPEPPAPTPTPLPPLPMPKAKMTPAPPAPTPMPVPVAQAPSERPIASPTPPVVANPQPQISPQAPPAAPIGPSAEYIAKVRAAVQAAFVYPSAAKDLEFSGRTRVAFKLLNTHMSAVRVLVGSGMKIVDAAALQAVQNAAYPVPPNDQKNKEESFEIWVEFRS